MSSGPPLLVTSGEAYLTDVDVMGSASDMNDGQRQTEVVPTPGRCGDPLHRRTPPSDKVGMRKATLSRIQTLQ